MKNSPAEAMAGVHAVLHSSSIDPLIFATHRSTKTMAASSDDVDVFTIHLDDARDVQMHFEVERCGSLRGVFDQYSIIEGVPCEFVSYP